MQTNFSAAALADPQIAEADKILRACVHCGLCTATCPTYLLLGDERDSPRGRIYLIKDMLEGGKSPTTEVGKHVDRCLSCLSCMTTCPGGVDYMHLVDIAREKIEASGTRGIRERFQRFLIAKVVPSPWRFRLALAGAVVAKPFAGFFARVGLKPLAAMLRMAPRPGLYRPRYPLPGTFPPKITKKRRVILLGGCAQQPLRPDINDATISLLTRLGVEVVVAQNAGCCGALVHHLGRTGEAKAQARRNIDAWMKSASQDPVDAVIVNASGCGTMVKDYGHLFKHDPDYAKPAAEIAARALDITEFLSTEDFGPPIRWSSLRVAYHSACSMQHGQQLSGPPRALLTKAGFSVQEIAEGHICCGSAGTYNLLQPELSGQLKSRKLANIEALSPDVVATGNIGCLTQLQPGTPIPIVHTIELIDWAYGGPVPRGLEHFAGKARDVQPGRPMAAAAAKS